MDGILVFDLSNDLIYKNLNETLNGKIVEIASERGLIENDSTTLTTESLIQIFTPVLANLRFMLIQFDNSFDYVKCEHGFNMVFGEHLGLIFITISDVKSVEFMHRSQGVFISFTRYIFGPLVGNLKTDNRKSEIVTNLFNKWKSLFDENQSVCLEVIEQLSVNSDVKNSIVSSLEVSLEKLKQDPQYSRSHALIFVKNKLLSMYSCRTSHQLSSSDIFFINLYCQIFAPLDKIDSWTFFMRGMTNNAMPHKIHRIIISPTISLILLSEYGNTIISTNLYSTIVQLSKIKILQAQCEMEGLVIETEKLDKYVKSVTEVAKKIKHNHDEEDAVKSFLYKYDNLKRKYVEMLKIMDKNQLCKVESFFPYFVDSAKDLFQILFLNDAKNAITSDQEKVLFHIASHITDRVKKYSEIIQAKLNNSVVMASYLEEFAGLVHFIYIDRQRGTCISPNINLTAKQTSKRIKTKVWTMIEVARTFLINGKTCCLWKDFGFSFCYNLWYEDSNCQPLKPKVQVNLNSTTSTVRTSKKVPGMLATDFYQNLIETHFPKVSNGVNKIKCFELFTMHLGLVTPQLQLEHSRRLVATIQDVTEISNNNLFDLL